MFTRCGVLLLFPTITIYAGVHVTVSQKKMRYYSAKEKNGCEWSNIVYSERKSDVAELVGEEFDFDESGIAWFDDAGGRLDFIIR